MQTHKVGDPLAFYSTVATVLPVLFLALLFQTKVFEIRLTTNDPQEPTRPGKWLRKRVPWAYKPAAVEVYSALFGLYLLFITAVGEYYCLRALYLREPPGGPGSEAIFASLYATSLTIVFQRLLIRAVEPGGRPASLTTDLLLLAFLILLSAGVLTIIL
jgi:hypothetical protein